MFRKSFQAIVFVQVTKNNLFSDDMARTYLNGVNTNIVHSSIKCSQLTLFQEKTACLESPNSYTRTIRFSLMTDHFES